MLWLIADAAARTFILVLIVRAGIAILRLKNPHLLTTMWRAVLGFSLLMPLLAHFFVFLSAYHGISLPVPFSADLVQPASAVLLPLEPSAHRSAVDPTVVLGSLYVVVMGALLVRLVGGLIVAQRLRRSARPVPASAGEKLDIRVCREIDSPLTFGRTILLPPDHVSWSERTMRAVLAHEGAHVRQWDFLTVLMSAINRAIFWFNPATWWLHRELARLSEARSDVAAIEALNDRLGYARILLGIAAGRGRIGVCAPMAHPATVAIRVQHILATVELPRRPSVRSASLVIASAGIVGALASGATAALPGVADDSPETVSERRYEQAKPRVEVAVDPDRLEQYLGSYQIGPTLIDTITRQGQKYFSQITGQFPLQVFPDAQGELFFKDVVAQLTFGPIVNGHATSLVLHQNGLEYVSPRISAEAAGTVEAWVAQRRKLNVPMAGSQQALQQTVEQQQRGQPDYSRLSPHLATLMRRQLPMMQTRLQSLGQLESVAFVGITMSGADVFDLHFQKGLWRARILLDASGTIYFLTLGPSLL